MTLISRLSLIRLPERSFERSFGTRTLGEYSSNQQSVGVGFYFETVCRTLPETVWFCLLRLRGNWKLLSVILDNP
jgi:hypothetical protein